MCFNKMAALSLSIDAIRPLNRWDHDSIRPGPSHSVGDALAFVRYKHSAPELPLRFDKDFSGKNGKILGNNNTDGDHRGYFTGGIGDPAVKDSNWGGRRHFNTRHGYIMQDLRAPDKLHEEFMGSTPQYQWRNRVATTYDAFRTGDKFLPLPGGYQPSPGEVERGQAVPVITNIEGGEPLAGGRYEGPYVNEKTAAFQEEMVRRYRNFRAGGNKKY